MPHNEFRWLTQEEIKNLDWKTWTADQEIGFIIECDLEYPEKYHNSQNSFPLAPESLDINSSHLSPYAKGEIKFIFYIC